MIESGLIWLLALAWFFTAWVIFIQANQYDIMERLSVFGFIIFIIITIPVYITFLFIFAIAFVVALIGYITQLIFLKKSKVEYNLFSYFGDMI